MDAIPTGRYRRVRLLGRGAMGEVWLADDTMLHRRVALKTLVSAAHAAPPDLEQAMREARLAAQLNSPNVVAVYDVIVENGMPCVVLEYVPGRSMADHIAESGRLPVAEVARIGIAVAEALAEAHALGMIHRDVKPANILISERGVPKLADFGIARLAFDAEQTVTGLTVGTPAYLAPEIARGSRSDWQRDIWSLGVTLYAALDGRSPFQRPGDNAIAVVGRLAQAPFAAPPVHGGPLTDTIMAMMSVDPGRRPPAGTVAEMLRADQARLESAEQATMQLPRMDPRQAAGSTPTFAAATAVSLAALSAPTAQTAQAARPRRGNTGIVVAAVAALLFVGGALGAYLWATRHGSGQVGANGSPSQTAATNRPPPSSAPASSSHRSSSASRSTPEAGGVRYGAPGGLSVVGPRGWTPDDSAGIANIRDFVAPGAADHQTGTYFRIGIGNADPKPTMDAETKQTIKYLTGKSNPYTDVQILATTPGSYLGADSVDIEFTGTNQQHVARHVLERLWISGGVTHLIQLNATSGTFTEYKPVFDQLVRDATLS